MRKYFFIGSKLNIAMPKECINDTVKDIVYGFFYRSVEVTYLPSDQRCIRIGNPKPVELRGGEGVISVTEDGVYIDAIHDRALLNCLFILLEKALPDNLSEGNERLLIPVGTEKVSPSVSRRMIHFCIAPKVPMGTYKKLFRLASVLGYTHIIAEFWGTFPYRCMEELSWKNESFSREEIAELFREATDLKLEMVPMLNSFGHAACGRMAFGKHVVLDQNPRKATLFSPDGWRWEFERPEVRELLKNMRRELYEVFGQGEYFHIGFDEGFSYPWNEESVESLSKYLKDLCLEIIAEGRTPMLWGDQFLHEPTLGINLEMGYEGNAPGDGIARTLLAALPKEAIVCDWQYFVKQGPWKTAEFFKDQGIRLMVCPWYDKEGFETAIQTAKEYECYGVLHTTWDHVFQGKGVRPLFHARDVFYGRGEATKKVGNRLEDATLMRKICFADGDYESAGWIRQDFTVSFSE